ncbi:hypothetical protein M885DRAFT_613773 [Pelagophyceae sp. CCMP2097]|nr:hypothetical protein M885DRAFT_613773 [Pelagophyceae sp. CCMP2097]
MILARSKLFNLQAFAAASCLALVVAQSGRGPYCQTPRDSKIRRGLTTKKSTSKIADELRKLRTENAQLKSDIHKTEELEVAELRKENEMLKAQQAAADPMQLVEETLLAPFDVVEDLFERPLWLSRENSLMREFDRSFDKMGLFPWSLAGPLASGAFSMSGPLVLGADLDKDFLAVEGSVKSALKGSMGDDVSIQPPLQQSYAVVDVDGVRTKSIAMKCLATSAKTAKKGEVQVRAHILPKGDIELDALFLDGTELDCGGQIGGGDSEQKKVSQNPNA